MKLPGNLGDKVGLVDLAMLTVFAVLVLLPDREHYTTSLYKGGAAVEFRIASAEARTLASPADGAALGEYTRQLSEAGYKDWSIDAAVAGVPRAAGSPSEWRALLAASVAYVDKLDVVPALDYANRALAKCRTDPQGCPSWEEVRMQLYQQHLDAGVKAGIDPRLEPKAFRAAGERVVRPIRLKNTEKERSDVPPKPQP